MELHELTATDFRRHVGDGFRVHYGGELPLPVRLSEVADSPLNAANLRAPFSLLFHGPKEGWLRQGTYTFEHDAMGRMDIFVVPLGADAEGMRYEVIFG